MMIMTRVLLVVVSISWLWLPTGHVFAQDAQRPQNAAPKIEMETVNLTHANAYHVAARIKHLQMALQAVAISDTKLVLRGPRTVLREVIEQIIPEVDVSTAEASQSSVILIRLGSISTVALKPLMNIVGGEDTRIAIDTRNNLLVVRGPEEKVQSIQEMIADLREDPKPLTLHFTFLSAQIGEGGKLRATDVPRSLKPVVDTLAENGLTQISVIAPVVIRTNGGEPFHSTSVMDHPMGSQADITTMEFSLEGKIDFDSGRNTCFLKVEADVGGLFGTQTHLNGRIFNVNTSMSLRLGQYVLLASSPMPSEGNASLILAIRVERGD